ncbi:MAG: hypothetical protein KAF91_09810 [Nostoc sp. TH1S01]|nr:hypothetical protein [Nostoc sp. TH1S01]
MLKFRVKSLTFRVLRTKFRVQRLKGEVNRAIAVWVGWEFWGCRIAIA